MLFFRGVGFFWRFFFFFFSLIEIKGYYVVIILYYKQNSYSYQHLEDSTNTNVIFRYMFEQVSTMEGNLCVTM